MEVKYSLNKLVFDEFGRPSGVLLLNKQPGFTAHDLVDEVRHKLDFKKVGHAGALDSFSSGLMLILVGKATKFSDQLMAAEKEYEAKMVLGVATETQDTEGQVTQVAANLALDIEMLRKTISDFQGSYNQYVSIFSSVKVEGKKLRKVLRDSRYTYKVVYDAENAKYIEIYSAQDAKLLYKIKVPQREVQIKKIEVLNITTMKAQDLPYKDLNIHAQPTDTFIIADFVVQCSKGTYIRQLAEDIGAKLELPASLIQLKRTMIGDLLSTDAIDFEQIPTNKALDMPEAPSVESEPLPE